MSKTKVYSLKHIGTISLLFLAGRSPELHLLKLVPADGEGDVLEGALGDDGATWGQLLYCECTADGRSVHLCYLFSLFLSQETGRRVNTSLQKETYI